MLLLLYLLACENEDYKPSKGNEACLTCGANSVSVGNPKISCQCRNCFYKIKDRENQTDCYGKIYIIAFVV